MVKSGVDVSALLDQLQRNPDLWNANTSRTYHPDSPHHEVSDIWVRFNPEKNCEGTFKEHESEWYPVIAKVPAAWSIARKIMRMVKGKRLGGILITKVPAGKSVKPHIDQGWHSRYYEKFAVQIKGNKDQAFCFDGDSLSAEPGDVYTFDNSKTHWVTNNSDHDRITLIICIKR